MTIRNRYDAAGNLITGAADNVTCPPELYEALADLFSKYSGGNNDQKN